MTTDPIYQMNLDLDTYKAYTPSNSTVSITSGTSATTAGTFTLNSNWDTSYNDCITIGGQTITESKLKVLDGLQDWQEEVNKKLAILQPNSELEEQWTELKEIRERYVKLEKELIEKNKVWDILKD
tara:strand:- start:180 stop:557 length:378 start_codon:yes stop_codon:yes gene_type:complete